MFCGKNLINQINHLHKRSPRIVYNDYESSFQELLELVNSVSNHHRNNRLLSIKLFKIKNGLSNHVWIIWFEKHRIQSSLRRRDFSLGAVYTSNNGLRRLKYFAPKNWNMIPADIRNINNLSDLTLKIHSWVPDGCPCTLYRVYIC